MNSMENLKSMTLHALLWSAIDNLGRVGIGLFIGIFLARLLEPEEFGLIGMLIIFIMLSQALMDSGFGSALIQKQRITDVDTSSVFFFNILIGVCIAGLLCLSAPSVAAFYDEPRLTSLVRALATIIIIDSLGVVHMRLMSKRMDFKTQARINILATVFSGGVAVFLAIQGFGVWSLVVQRVGNSVLKCALLWIMSPWRPTCILQFKVLREMFPFGFRVLATELIATASGNFFRILIGKLYLPSDLGYVERAYSVTWQPFVNLTYMFARVMFPSFATIQKDTKLLKTGLRKFITTLALLVFPMVIGLVVTARPLVLALYTEKWAPAIPYLQVCALEFLFYPLYVIHLNLFKSCGRSDLLLRTETLKRFAAILAVLIASMWGILAMLWAHVGVSLMSYGFVCVYTRGLIKYQLIQQIRDLAPCLATACIMGLGVCLFKFLPFENPWLQLLSQVLAGVFIFGLLCMVLRLPPFLELKDTMLTKMRYVLNVQA